MPRCLVATYLVNSSTHKANHSPLPLGEGLGVRPYKANHSPLPLERGWG